MKMIKKIVTILFLLVVCATMFSFAANQVLATGNNFDLDAFDTEPTEAAGMKNLVNDTAITAISVMRIVCVTIAIVILLAISMKYMMSAPGDRADIKKHAVHYVIGAFILFGVTGILGILDNFAKQI